MIKKQSNSNLALPLCLLLSLSLIHCAPIPQQELETRSERKAQEKQLERQARAQTKAEKAARKQAEREAKYQEQLARKQAKLDQQTAEENARRQASLDQQQQKWNTYQQSQQPPGAGSPPPTTPPATAPFGLPTVANKQAIAPAPPPNPAIQSGQAFPFPPSARSRYPATQPSDYPTQPATQMTAGGWPIANHTMKIINLTGRTFAASSEEGQVYQQNIINQRLNITLQQSQAFVIVSGTPPTPGQILINAELVVSQTPAGSAPQLVNTLTLSAFDAANGAFLANVKNRVQTSPSNGIKPSLQALLNQSVIRLAQELTANTSGAR